MQKFILDSSVWIAYFNKADLFYAEAKNIFANISKKEAIIIMPEIIFAETVNILKKHLGKNKTLEVIAKIKKIKFIKLAHGLSKFWFEFFPIYSEINLKSSDAIILAYAKFLHVDYCFTFDKKLQKAYLKN